MAEQSTGTTESTLGERYDQLYAADQQLEDAPLLPIAVAGWPADRNQALVFLTRPGGRLLEIGCGQGRVLATLAPQFDHVVGTELSSVRADATRRRLAHLPNCTIFCGDLAELAADPTQRFDCILWADVIEHIGDVVGAMHTVARLANPGAQLVTVTPNVAYLPQRLRLLLGRGPATSLPLHRNEGFTDEPNQTVLLDGGHFHYFTYRQVEILYRLAGFTPERRMGIGGRLSKVRNIWPTLLSGAVCVAGRKA